MADYKDIAGRIRTAAYDGVAVEAQEILDINKNKKQSEVNAETDATLAEHTSTINGLNSQNYVTVTATDQTTAVTDVLPATGEVATVYRVGNWDGSQYDETCYSEYSWNGSAYVHLSTKTQIGEVFDISAYHATGGTLATYADLAAALGTNGANIPESLRKGGMSVKYVLTSDNKYVQFRYMSSSTDVADFTNVANWQGVTDEINSGDKNIITSGGVFNKFLYKTPTPNLFDISNPPHIDKGSDVVYTISAEQGTITISNATSSGERFNIDLPAHDSTKTYTLTFKFQRNRPQTIVHLFTSNSSHQTITLDENGYGKVEGFTGGDVRYLNVSIKNLDGTVVLSDIVLTEDIEIEEYIKTEILKHIGVSNFNAELSDKISKLDSILANGYVYFGISTSSTDPGSPNVKGFYIALTEGIYTNFGNITVSDGITILKWNGSVWSNEELFLYNNNYYMQTDENPNIFDLDTCTVSTSNTIVASKDTELGKITLYSTSTDSGQIFRFTLPDTSPSKRYKLTFKVAYGVRTVSTYMYKGGSQYGTGLISIDSNGVGSVIFTGNDNLSFGGSLKSYDAILSNPLIYSDIVLIEDVQNTPHIKSELIKNLDIENLSKELAADINYIADKNKIELTVSAENVTKEGGRYCHAVGSKGICLSGTGTKTITLSHTDSVGDATIMTFGLLTPWSTQNVASVALTCGDTTHTISKAEVDSRTEMGHAYRAQGNTYNRVSFYASDTNITITVTTEDSADAWMIEISDSIVLDDVYKKTPILVEYDAGGWNGEITDGNDTFNQWEMHRRLNIPYGINISDAAALNEFDEYAALSINEGLAEVGLRYAGTTYYKDPEADLMGNINETFESLPVATKGVVGLGQNVYDKKLLRCLKKGGVKIVRNASSNNGGITMKGSDTELIVCDGHFMNSKTTIPLYGLPVILWCHGVGTVPDDDPNKRYYSDGTRVLALLKWLKQKEEEGVVELLSPSEFAERLK